jgi:hypothetical protein
LAALKRLSAHELGILAFKMAFRIKASFNETTKPKMRLLAKKTLLIGRILGYKETFKKAFRPKMQTYYGFQTKEISFSEDSLSLICWR